MSKKVKLVIMRHGDYNRHGFLTESGKQKVLDAVKKIVEKVGKLGETAVFASDEFRALDSALLVLKYLKENNLVEASRVKIGTDWSPIKEEFSRIIEDGQKDTILWFAHFEEIENFAPHFREGLPYVPDKDNNYGTTMIIDIESNTAEIVQAEG